MIQSGITTKEVVDTIQLNLDPDDAGYLYNALVELVERELTTLLCPEEYEAINKTIKVLAAARNEQLKLEGSEK